MIGSWTHVAGVIRLDDIRLDRGPALAYLETVRKLGIKTNWDDIRFGQVELPQGSILTPLGTEGSLNWEITEDKLHSRIASFVVTIYGDLKDYNDVTEIKTWFLNILKGVLVRQAILTIEVEHQLPVICFYKESEDCLLTFDQSDIFFTKETVSE